MLTGPSDEGPPLLLTVMVASCFPKVRDEHLQNMTALLTLPTGPLPILLAGGDVLKAGVQSAGREHIPGMQ